MIVVELNRGQARSHIFPCYVGSGCSVDQAAEVLKLSSDTIKGYLTSIYTKLQVTNRSEVTLEAIRLGIIDSV